MAYSNPKSLQNLGGLPFCQSVRLDPAVRAGLWGEGVRS